MSRENEYTLLATIITGGDFDIGSSLFSEASEAGITKDSFTDTRAVRLWDSLGGLNEENVSIDENHALTAFQGQNGDAMDFFDVMKFGQTPVQMPRYIEQVLEKHVLRQIERSARVAQERIKEGMPSSEVMGELDASIRKISSSGDKGVTISGAVDEFLDDLFGDIDSSQYIKTGIDRYDASLDRNGFAPSQLVVIAGRPGCGKTALALNIAHRAVKKGQPVGFFSLEMGASELMGRMLSMETNVPMTRFRDKLQTRDQMQKLKDAKKASKKWPLRINDSAFNLPMILAIARNWHRRYDIKVIIIDYCQLIRCDAKIPREQQVANISRECKLLAKSLKIPVLLLAQMNRESEKESREPRASDLRESGALEQDADSITFLYLDGEDDKNGNEVRWVRPKQRGGVGYDKAKVAFIRQVGIME